MTRRLEIERRRSDVALVPGASRAPRRPLARAQRTARVVLAGAGLLLAAACQKEPAPSVQSEPPREPAAAAAPVAAAGSVASASSASAPHAEAAPAAAAAPGAVLAKYQPAAATAGQTSAGESKTPHEVGGTPGASSAADGPAQAPGQPVQGAAVSEEPFSIWLQAVSPIAAGSAATVEAVLVAKPPYHCNADYPHKFKLAAAPSGLAYPETTVKGAKVTAEKSVLPIPVRAQSPGKAKVSGTLSFSVCDEERCLVEKRDLAVELEVK